MGKCKDCTYWEKDKDVAYNENFGWCNCEKFAYAEDLEEYDYDKRELKRKNYEMYMQERGV